MGFIKEIYSDNRAGLVVAFGRGETSANYFNGDSAEEAMKHFNIYLKNNEMYIKTKDEKAISSLGIKAEDASEFRSTVDAIIVTLTDEQASAAPILFPIWQADIAYKVGDRVRHNNKLYKVLQDHTSQSDWSPSVAPSLFTAILIDETNNTILEWVQPNSENAYKVGDKVIYNGIYYISTIDNNCWEPGVVDARWDEYIPTWENGVAYGLNQKVLYNEVTYISLITNNTIEPSMDEVSWKIYLEDSTEEVTEWFQPDASNAYMIGDRVLFNGIIYESLIDDNVWSPEAYPMGWSEVVE